MHRKVRAGEPSAGLERGSCEMATRACVSKDAHERAQVRASKEDRAEARRPNASSDADARAENMSSERGTCRGSGVNIECVRTRPDVGLERGMRRGGGRKHRACERAKNMNLERGTCCWLRSSAWCARARRKHEPRKGSVFAVANASMTRGRTRQDVNLERGTCRGERDRKR